MACWRRRVETTCVGVAGGKLQRDVHVSALLRDSTETRTLHSRTQSKRAFPLHSHSPLQAPHNPPLRPPAHPGPTGPQQQSSSACGACEFMCVRRGESELTSGRVWCVCVCVGGGGGSEESSQCTRHTPQHTCKQSDTQHPATQPATHGTQPQNHDTSKAFNTRTFLECFQHSQEGLQEHARVEYF